MDTLNAQGFNQLKQGRHGWMIYNRHDRYIGKSIENYGEFSEGEIELLRQVIGPGATAVDIGANYGTHTLAFAQIVGNGGRVHAFEPQPLVFQALCGTVALNSLTQVRSHNCALSHASGSMRVPVLSPVHENNFGGLSMEEHEKGEMVQVRTLDSYELEQCHLMKIDVEGMERDVLAGATETIERCKPVLYVENDRREKSEDLVRYLNELGYDMYWHQPPMFNPNNFASNPVDIFGNIVSRNMLCCHRGRPSQISGLQKV